MEEQNDLFESEAMKYVDWEGQQSKDGDASSSDTQSEATEEDSPQEAVADTDSMSEDREKKEKAYHEAQERYQNYLKKRNENFKSKGIDIEAEKEKLKNVVTPESNAVFLAWLNMRFPDVFERLMREKMQVEREQMALEQSEEKEWEELLNSIEDNNAESNPEATDQ